MTEEKEIQECDCCEGTGIQCRQCPDCGETNADPSVHEYFCNFCGGKMEEIQCLKCNEGLMTY